MRTFSQYFFSSYDQVLALSSVALLWLSLSGLGAWISGKERVAPADVISGWAIVSIILTVGGVFGQLNFSFLISICGFVTLLSFIFVAKREGLWLPIPFFKLLLLGIPLLLIASSMQGSQWDEFSDWLVIPRYLFTTDQLPSSFNPYHSANTVAYPFNWHFINYLASSISGKFLENIGPLFNVLLLLTFALGLLKVINRISIDDKIFQTQNWSMVAGVGLIVTLLNPTFAQKIVLTSYADTSTAVVTGFATILAWFTLECLSEGNRRGTRNCAFQLSMAFVVLINLKQATFVIYILIIAGFLIAAFRDRSINLFSASKIIILAALPALFIYMTWRYHIFSELAGGEAGLMPFGEWHFEHIPQILLQMFITLLKKGYYFLLVIIILVLSIFAFAKCETPENRLLLVSGFVILSYNAFLFFAYLSSFNAPDALRVASFWRYNMHMGAIVITGASVCLVTLLRRFSSSGKFWKKVSWLPPLLLIIAPCAFVEKLRFDLNPMIQHYRSIGKGLSSYIEPQAGYFVLDPQGTGESYNITRYEMKDHGKPLGYLAAYHSVSKYDIKNLIANNDLKYLMVYSLSSVIKEVFPLDLRQRQSHLLVRKHNGWSVMVNWPLPHQEN